MFNIAAHSVAPQIGPNAQSSVLQQPRRRPQNGIVRARNWSKPLYRPGDATIQPIGTQIGGGTFKPATYTPAAAGSGHYSFAPAGPSNDDVFSMPLPPKPPAAMAKPITPTVPPPPPSPPPSRSRDPFAGWTPPTPKPSTQSLWQRIQPGLSRAGSALGRLAWGTFAPPDVQNANTLLNSWMDADNNPTVNRLRTGTPHPQGIGPAAEADTAAAVEQGRHDAIGQLYGMPGPATPAVMGYHNQQQQRAAAIQGNYDLPDSPAVRRAAITDALRGAAVRRTGNRGATPGERALGMGYMTPPAAAPPTPQMITRAPMIDAPSQNTGMVGGHPPIMGPPPLTFMDNGERTAPQVVGGLGHRILRRTDEMKQWDQNAIAAQQRADAERINYMTPEQKAVQASQTAGRGNPLWMRAHEGRAWDMAGRRAEREFQAQQKSARRDWRMSGGPQQQMLQQQMMARHPELALGMMQANMQGQLGMAGLNLQQQQGQQMSAQQAREHQERMRQMELGRIPDAASLEQIIQSRVQGGETQAEARAAVYGMYGLPPGAPGAPGAPGMAGGGAGAPSITPSPIPPELRALDDDALVASARASGMYSSAQIKKMLQSRHPSRVGVTPDRPSGPGFWEGINSLLHFGGNPMTGPSWLYNFGRR